MKRRKIDKEELAWWVYVALLVALTIYGLWNSTAAELLIRALGEAFTLLIGQ